jgi:hypothetical protein
VKPTFSLKNFYSLSWSLPCLPLSSILNLDHSCSSNGLKQSTIIYILKKKKNQNENNKNKIQEMGWLATTTPWPLGVVRPPPRTKKKNFFFLKKEEEIGP